MTVWAVGYLYDDSYETGVGIIQLYASKDSAQKRAETERVGRHKEIYHFASFQAAVQSGRPSGVAVFPMGIRE